MSGIGQCDPSRAALEQVGAEVTFERLDLLADGRSAHVEQFGCACEVFHAGRRFEYSEPV